MSDYKINPESIPKQTIYKIEKLTDADVIGESTKTLNDLLMESYKHALQEGIRANTVILDEHFCKVNGFDLVPLGFDGRVYRRLPPMICGMEIRGVSKGELPEGYNFAVLEAPMTEREILIRNTVDGMYNLLRHELAKVMRIRAVDDNSPNMDSSDVWDILIRVRDTMLKGERKNDSSTDESSGS